MKILVIGDLFGYVGRKMIIKNLQTLKKEKEIDLTIVNVENTTSGRGLSYSHYKQLNELGIDVMTSGNHIFDQLETINYIEKVDNLLRPLNSNPYHKGPGSIVINKLKKKIRITNLLGVVFMNNPGSNPYFALEKIIEEDDSDIHLVDFHAEATAEKIAFALHFDGKITALWGTHTHVATADEQILKNGTAYITDIGMTGPRNGVIGAEAKGIIKRSRESLPMKIVPDIGKGQLNGIIITINEDNNKVNDIQRIKLLED